VLSRRDFVVGALSTGAIACARPVIKSSAPALTHGVQAGDVQTDRAVIWARANEPARMIVEWDTSEGFGNPRAVRGPIVGPDSDYTGTVPITGLPAAQTVFYRVRFEREAARGASAWAVARFRTPAPEAVHFAWTGDTCGQGYGRNPEWGGLRGYAAIRNKVPDFLLHSGDLIYADNPILAEVRFDDGRIWRNITNERVARVAESLDDFRARFAYNLEDEHVRALAAECPILAQWDDHETHNNWWPGQKLDDERYTERDASVLSSRARQATFEWTPIGRGADPVGRDATIHRVIHYGPLLDVVVVDLRSFRSGNDSQTQMMGAAQVKWLGDALAASKARWKIIACDQPLALVIEDGPNNERREGFGDGQPTASGREQELVTLLADLKSRSVGNTIWLTADVHYAAAHRFDPSRATAAKDFDPFWEFVAGPIHAGTFGPNALDPSLGPELKFHWVPEPHRHNVAPWDDMQTFGTVDLSAEHAAVALHDISGHERYRVEIPYR
jgi:alkaline phosphatase D